MRKTVAISLAALGALAVHAVILLFGGVLASPAPAPRATEVRNVELRSARKPVDQVAAAKPAAREQPKPEQRSEERKPEKAAASDAKPAERPAEDAEGAERLAKAEALPPAEAPVRTETPKAPDATAEQARLAKSDVAKPGVEPDQRRAPAEAKTEAGPAQVAAAQARDADVLAGPGDDASGGAGTEPELPEAPPVPEPTFAAQVAPDAVPQATDAVREQPAAIPAAPAMPQPAPAASPAPRPLRNLNSIPRIGPAWNAAAAQIGPVPPTAGAAPVAAPAAAPITPRRRREIPPVDIAAATTRTPVPYRPLNLGGPEPSAAALDALAAAAATAPVPSSAAAPRAAASIGPSPASSSSMVASGSPARKAGAVGARPSVPAATAVPPGPPTTASRGTGRGSGSGTGNGASAGTGTRGGQPADRGFLSPGSQVRQEPVARIAWGSADEATRTLDIGRMQLVAVDADLKIVAGLEPGAGRWTRTAAPAQMGAYSNRVRVVDHVAGFAEQALLCGPGEHLAVVVPVGLDRRIEKAMDQAARREGLSRDQVSACYGRLVAQPTGIEFQVDRVERRTMQ